MTNTVPEPRQLVALAAPRSLTELIDRTAIIDALYRFGAGQDLKDRALFESAFTRDARLDFRGPARRFGVSLPLFEGIQTIGDAVFATIGALRTTHTVTNPRVTIDGDRARLFALVEAQHVDAQDDERCLLLKNTYWVDLERMGDGWAIRHMRIENVWYRGEPAVLFATAQA